MKFLITIKASLTKGKSPKVTPARYFITEAFNDAQVSRRLLMVQARLGVKSNVFTVEPLDEWLKAIPTL